MQNANGNQMVHNKTSNKSQKVAWNTSASTEDKRERCRHFH